MRRLAVLDAHRIGPPAVLLVAVAIFVTLPAQHGLSHSSFSLFTVMQVFGTYGLVVLALGLTMIAGEFDLSTLGMYGLGAMVAVHLGKEQPALGLAAAVGVGCVSGLLQGGVIARLGLNSMAVTLGGYITLLGLTATIGNDQTVRYGNIPVSLKLGEPILTIFTQQSLMAVGGFLLVGFVLACTRTGREIRAIGGDRGMSRVAGVRSDLVLVGVFVASGALSGLAGGLNGYALSSASSTPGVAPLVFAATAALVGGVAVSGGRGSVTGIACGVLALSFLQSTFGIIASPNWVAAVVTGALLAASVVGTAPATRPTLLRLRQRLRRGAGTSPGAEQPPVRAP